MYETEKIHEEHEEIEVQNEPKPTMPAYKMAVLETEWESRTNSSSTNPSWKTTKAPKKPLNGVDRLPQSLWMNRCLQLYKLMTP